MTIASDLSTGYDWSQGLTVPTDIYPRSGMSSWAQPYAQSLLGGFFGGWMPSAQTNTQSTTQQPTATIPVSQPVQQQSSFSPYYVDTERYNAIKNYNLPSQYGGGGYNPPAFWDTAQWGSELIPSDLAYALGTGYSQGSGYSSGIGPNIMHELKPEDIPANLGDAILKQIIPGYDIEAARQYYANGGATPTTTTAAPTAATPSLSAVPAGMIQVSDSAGNIIGYQDPATGQITYFNQGGGTTGTGGVYTGGSQYFDETTGQYIGGPDATSSPSYALDQAIQALTGAPDLIEQQRQAMLDQYWQTVPGQINNMLYSNLNDLGQRGVISGTPMQNAIQGIGNTIAEGGQKTQTEAQQWSANALLQNLKDIVEARSGQTNLLGSLLGSFQESTNPWAPYQSILDLFKYMG